MTGKMNFFGGGVAAAMGAALLFGAGTPLAKMLLGSVGPWMLAGLFYLGSGLELTLYRLAVKAATVRLAGHRFSVGMSLLAIERQSMCIRAMLTKRLGFEKVFKSSIGVVDAQSNVFS